MRAIFYPDVPFESLMIPYILKEIYLDQVYSDVLNKDMTIIDVGANIGLVTAYFQPFSKKIYAIEPSPEEEKALSFNQQHNNWYNVEVFNCAITDWDGTVQLGINEANRTMNTTVNGTKNMVEVKCMRLDTFFKKNNVEHVDFMKFDVEGAEDLILRGEGFLNVAEKIDSIMVEFHNMPWEPLSEHLLSLGYHGRRYTHTGAVLCFYQRNQHG